MLSKGNDSIFCNYFIDNTAEDNDGGALYVEGSLTANDACFRGNHAIVDGGAVFASDNVNLDNCLFESNQAKGANKSISMLRRSNTLQRNRNFSQLNIQQEHCSRLRRSNICKIHKCTFQRKRFHFLQLLH